MQWRNGFWNYTYIFLLFGIIFMNFQSGALRINQITQPLKLDLPRNSKM